MTEQKINVFLCHNRTDAAVVEIAEQLRRNGVTPCSYVWELRSETIWQFALKRQIERIGAVVVFAGQKGMVPWQSEEAYAFLQEVMRRGCPVIPVMLPNTPTPPRLQTIFLKNCPWVDFRLQKPDPLSQLLWGITGVGSGGSLKVSEPTSIQDAEQTIMADVGLPNLDVQYRALRSFLRKASLKEADEETYELMSRSMGRSYRERCSAEDMLKFPCDRLNTIDGLWMKYTGGKFGFSAQKELYLECGGVLDGKYHEEHKEVWVRFCEVIGWNRRTYQEPRGYRPLYWLEGSMYCISDCLSNPSRQGYAMSSYMYGEKRLPLLLHRLANCNA